MICITTYSDEYLGSSDSSDFGDDHDIISSNNKLNDDGWARDKSQWGRMMVKGFIGTVLVLVLKNERFVKFFIPILSQVIGTIKYSKIPSFCCCSY